MNKILIIEDDINIRLELAKLLNKNNYITDVIDDFDNYETFLKENTYDLILLDIILPYKDGYEICKNIKSKYNTPIIFVTSRNTDEDELKSIISGGDDFITKPYNKAILLEKIKRTLEKNNPTYYKEITVNEVTLDLHLSLIKYKNKELELTRNEFRILYYLFLNADTVVTKNNLIEYLWNDKFYIDENILNVNVNRLRKKLEEINIKDFIKTVHGKGYMIWIL